MRRESFGKDRKKMEKFDFFEKNRYLPMEKFETYRKLTKEVWKPTKSTLAVTLELEIPRSVRIEWSIAPPKLEF